MKDFLLFVIAICVGFTLMVAYSTFVVKSAPVQMPGLKTIFKSSNFSLEKAPSKSLVGKIISMSGDVEWQSRIATDSAKINSPIDIQQGENLTTKDDGKAVILFDKNLEVDMSPKSEVGFAQTLPADIVLVQGSGTVEYKKLGEVPVSIRVFHLLIENGGDISISVDDQIPVATISVISGSITYSFNDIDNVTSITTIGKGEKLIFNDGTRQAVVK